MTEQYFKRDAEQLVDMLFDNKLFREGLTTENMNSIEELIAFTLQSKFDTHWRAKQLFDKLNSNKKQTP